jgi:hypothetical protein
MSEVTLSRLGFWPLPLYQSIIENPTIGWQAIGKVVQNITFEVPALPNWELSDWGYGKGKEKQLYRNYINEEEFSRVLSVLKRRQGNKYTSVAVSLRGAPKDSRSQGWCMLSLVISRNKDWHSVEVQYRTTEAILKFAADVWLLRKLLQERFEIIPNVCRFRFANCALSGAYFPYLVDKMDLVGFLKEIQVADHEFFLRTTRFLLKSSYRKDQFHPFSPERVSHKYLWERASARQIKAITGLLEPFHRASGRPLPKDFHDKSYVPKGQRKASSLEEDSLEDDDEG